VGSLSAGAARENGRSKDYTRCVIEEYKRFAFLELSEQGKGVHDFRPAEPIEGLDEQDRARLDLPGLNRLEERPQPA
jgi:hypothetical protein